MFLAVKWHNLSDWTEELDSPFLKNLPSLYSLSRFSSNTLFIRPPYVPSQENEQPRFLQMFEWWCQPEKQSICLISSSSRMNEHAKKTPSKWKECRVFAYKIMNLIYKRKPVYKPVYLHKFDIIFTYHYIAHIIILKSNSQDFRIYISATAHINVLHCFTSKKTTF